MNAPSAESGVDCILFDLVLEIADVGPITAKQFLTNLFIGFILFTEMD